MTDPYDGDPGSGAIDETLERRIVRQLDGELNATEREALDRDLLRDPPAHRLRDEYAAADRAAGEALRAAFGAAAGECAARLAAVLRRPGGRRPRLAAAALVAAAGLLLACAAAGIVAALSPGGGLQGPQPARVASRPAGPAGPVAPAIPAGVEAIIWQAWGSALEDAAAAGQPSSAGPGGEGRNPRDAFVPLPPIQGPREKRRTVDRQLYGAWDERGETFYLLGVDHVRTRVHAVRDDL